MKVAIIDSKKHRGEALQEAIKSLGHSVLYLERPWGSGVTPPQNWPLQAQQKPDGMEVIFLHVGEDQFPEPGIATVLGQCYGAHALVCYSGAEIREEFKIEINRHETWCAYAGGATVPLVSESLE